MLLSSYSSSLCCLGDTIRCAIDCDCTTKCRQRAQDQGIPFFGPLACDHGRSFNKESNSRAPTSPPADLKPGKHGFLLSQARYDKWHIGSRLAKLTHATSAIIAYLAVAWCTSAGVSTPILHPCPVFRGRSFSLVAETPAEANAGAHCCAILMW